MSAAERRVFYFLAVAVLRALAACSMPPTADDAQEIAAHAAAAKALAAQSATIAATHFAYCSTAATPSPPIQAPPQIASRPGYLEFSATVTDKSGVPISGLKETEFAASSSGMPVPIVYFHESSDAPLTIGLLVDTSGSMEPKLPTVRSALVDFLSKSNPCDELFLFAFTWRPYMLQPPTTDHAAVASHLMTLRAWGQTSMYDAIFDGLQILQKARYARRALLVITDGMDNTSRTTLAQVTALARQQAVPIYVIGIGRLFTGQQLVSSYGDAEWVDAKALDQLANVAGGQASIVPSTGNQFADAVESVEERLSRSYTIGVIISNSGTPSVHPVAISSPAPPASESTVRLIVANHPNAFVTTQIIEPPHP
jgi:Ca-activated chloride channel family protein